jgi:hypothetical protein
MTEQANPANINKGNASILTTKSSKIVTTSTVTEWAEIDQAIREQVVSSELSPDTPATFIISEVAKPSPPHFKPPVSEFPKKKQKRVIKLQSQSSQVKEPACITIREDNDEA